MKGIIQDRAVLATLKPLEVAAYLRSQHWRQQKLEPGKYSVWVKPSKDAESFEVLVPLDPDFRDYSLRMADLLAVLAAAEARSQFEIFRDLQASAADLIRIRLLGKESMGGTVPIEQGVDLIGHARDLLMASACATVDPRPWFRSRRPSQAEEYLRAVRLGQTEIGSYVVTVLSRVPPALAATSLSTDTPAEEPFERQVTTMLAQALAATRRAAEDSVATGDLSAFREAIRFGVTVNLCDAIAGLAPNPRAQEGVRIEISWSPTRPQIARVPSVVMIPSDTLEVVAEAGRMLRETSPLEDIELRGVVVRLERPEGAAQGTATVIGSVEGQTRKVRILLGESDYQTAIQAHVDRLTVLSTGDVSRDGKALVMARPKGFAILEAL